MQELTKTFTLTLHFTWKISSLWDSNECSFSLRFLKSQRATVYKKQTNKKNANSSISYCCMSQNGDRLSIRATMLRKMFRGKRAAPPYLQSQWPGWTRCRGWRTDSWPLQCERPLHGWASRYYWTACPSFTYNREKVLGWEKTNKKTSQQILCCWAAHIMSFWSSATDPNRDSCRRCQETSSTTAVWPVKMVLASTIFPSLGTVLMSQRQIVCEKKQKW